jgi:hypothetical protein
MGLDIRTTVIKDNLPVYAAAGMAYVKSYYELEKYVDMAVPIFINTHERYYHFCMRT